MKIILAHVYFIHEDKTEQEVMRPYPPLGLLYVSGYLQSKSIDHEVFDGTFSSFEKLLEYLKSRKPDVIAMYANFLTRLNVVKIINKIREIPEISEMKIVLGGPDVRYHQDEYLGSGADFLVLGEGELTFYEWIEMIRQKDDYRQISGLVFKDVSGMTVQTGERKHIAVPDELPQPNREKIDLQKYLDAWKKNHGYSSITVNTQRGCPYTCRWCSHAVFGDTYRRRSPANVVDEIEYLKKRYNPDSFWFVDDVFTMSEKWIVEFENELSERNISISYECITRADRLSDNLLKTLKNTGCRLLWIGAESGSQKVIDLMDRRVDIHKVREMIKKAKNLGIETGTFIMLGYPGETKADILETIRHLQECQPDHFTINLAYPIKGTKLHDTIEDQIPANHSWPEPIDRDIDFKRTYRRPFYNMAIRKVYNEVFFQKQMRDREYIKAVISKAKSLAASAGMLVTK